MVGRRQARNGAAAALCVAVARSIVRLMEARSYFVTGTGTGVGKTHVCCRLLEHWRSQGIAAAGYKPLSCGDRGDAVALQAAAGGGLTLEEINPVHFKTPAAPWVAALIENREVDLAAVRAGYERLGGAFPAVLVEGVGGWEVPLTGRLRGSDLATELGLPVLVVADNRLGALNHCILTVNAILGRGLRCAGIILNHVAEERDAASISNRRVLEHFLQVPVVAEILHGGGWPEEPEELPAGTFSAGEALGAGK